MGREREHARRLKVLAPYQVNSRLLHRAKPDAIVMHPGPMNRGVEITSEVADGPQSVIRRQVGNGVAVRMAVLATIVRNVQARNIEAGRRAG